MKKPLLRLQDDEDPLAVPVAFSLNQENGSIDPFYQFTEDDLCRYTERCWCGFRHYRLELGRVLAYVKPMLARKGRGGDWEPFLRRAGGIPRKSADRFIVYWETYSGMPATLRDAAYAVGIDLSRPAVLDVVKQLVAESDGNPAPTTEQLAGMVERLQAAEYPKGSRALENSGEAQSEQSTKESSHSEDATQENESSTATEQEVEQPVDAPEDGPAPEITLQYSIRDCREFYQLEEALRKAYAPLTKRCDVVLEAMRHAHQQIETQVRAA